MRVVLKALELHFAPYVQGGRGLYRKTPSLALSAELCEQGTQCCGHCNGRQLEVEVQRLMSGAGASPL